MKILLFVLAGLLYGCSPYSTPVELSATVQITYSEQQGEHFYFVYQINNIGPYIDYYEIFYTLSTSAGDMSFMTNGVLVLIDEERIDVSSPLVGDVVVYNIHIDDFLLYRW